MDQANRSEVLQKACGEANEGKVSLLLNYAAQQSVEEVPDPYPLRNRGSSFDETCDFIEHGCRGLLADIKAELKLG